MRTIEDRLAAYLHTEDQTWDPPGAGPEAAQTRGEHLRRRRQLGSAIGAFVVVLVLGSVAAMVFRSSTPTQFEAAEAEQALSGDVGAATPVTIGESLLDWESVAGTVGYTETLFAEDGVLYGLSTAPGAKWTGDGPPPARAVYRSTDGVSWSHHLLSDELRATDLAGYGGVLYAVATAPSPGEIRIGTSTDGGGTWDVATVATGITEPQLGIEQFTNTSIDIAAGSAGVVAAVRTSMWAAWHELVPEEYRDGEFEVRPNADGIEVLDWGEVMALEIECADAQQLDSATDDTLPPTTTAPGVDNAPGACERLMSGDFEDVVKPVFSATWDELGVEDPGRLQSFRTFYSTDGEVFEPVDLPAGPSTNLVGLEATERGFVAVLHDAESMSLLRSADGRSWQAVPIESDVHNVQTVGLVDDTIVLVGSRVTRGEDGESLDPVVLTMPWGGSSMGEIDLQQVAGESSPDEERWVGTASIGPAGVVLVMSSWTPLDPGDPETEWESAQWLLHSADLETWSVEPIGDADERVYAAVVGDAEIHVMTERYADGEPAVTQLIGTLRGG